MCVRIRVGDLVNIVATKTMKVDHVSKSLLPLKCCVVEDLGTAASFMQLNKDFQYT